MGDDVECGLQGGWQSGLDLIDLTAYNEAGTEGRPLRGYLGGGTGEKLLLTQ